MMLRPTTNPATTVVPAALQEDPLGVPLAAPEKPRRRGPSYRLLLVLSFSALVVLTGRGR